MFARSAAIILALLRANATWSELSVVGTATITTVSHAPAMLLYTEPTMDLALSWASEIPQYHPKDTSYLSICERARIRRVLEGELRK